MFDVKSVIIIEKTEKMRKLREENPPKTCTKRFRKSLNIVLLVYGVYECVFVDLYTKKIRKSMPPPSGSPAPDRPHVIYIDFFL